MDEDQVAEMLTAIELAWPRDRPAGWQKIWVPHLWDLPVGPAMEAMRTLMRTKTFPPSIAEVREATAAAAGLLPPADGVEQGLRWASAWDRAEMVHGPEPERPGAAVVKAVTAFGGPFAVVADPEGWTRYWGAAQRQLREDVLLGDIGQLRLEA